MCTNKYVVFINTNSANTGQVIVVDKLTNLFVNMFTLTTTQARLAHVNLRIKSFNDALYFHLYNNDQNAVIHSSTDLKNTSLVSFTVLTPVVATLTNNFTMTALTLSGGQPLFQIGSNSLLPTDIKTSLTSTPNGYPP